MSGHHPWPPPPAVRTVGPRGIHFRSRLEARWATFFTLCHWQWEYEPELGLDRWFPDFAILSGQGLLVEVKPALSYQELTQHRERIDESGNDRPVWIVGATLAVAHPLMNEPCIGQLKNIALWGPTSWPFLIQHLRGTDPARIIGPQQFAMAQRAWVAAGNELQWRT